VALNATPEHFERLHAFLKARIDPLLDPATGSKHGFADDDASRALRALSHQIDVEFAAASLIGEYEKEDAGGRSYIERRTDAAWDTLRGIGRHWEDHPDYLPEFGLHSFDLSKPASGS